MSQNNENNLISIDDVIFRAKKRGIDFGKGDPRERLRYLTKIGLLPHAKRKSFNGQPPNGAYPEYIVELLKEIDEKIKVGKSIQDIKKEKERKDLVEAPYTYIYPLSQEVPRPKIETPIYSLAQEVPQPEIETPRLEKEEIFFKLKSFARVATLLKIIFLIFIFSGIIFLSGQAIKEDFHFYLLASFNSWVQRLVQAPPTPIEERPEIREIFLPVIPEPYLTINAETDINAPLNVKEQITAPSLSLLRDEFRATLGSADLTADRTYTFPNLSGVVCLTAGNCIGIGGEVFSPGGIPNRLAKFINEQEIGVSSIEDQYPGVALTIDSGGRVGVGIRNPRYALHVAGRIQVTGDICTDLAGGRCLSAIPLIGPSPPPIFMPPPPAAVPVEPGIEGAGTANYLPIWTAGDTLGDSIIFQSNGNIGIGMTNPAHTLDVYGTTRVRGFIMPTGAAPGYILTSDAAGVGVWREPPIVTWPVGTDGQTLRHDGISWVANSFLHNTGAAIGIGTTITPATLTMSGNALFTTTILPQLALRYNADNYLNFAITGEQSLIEASKRLVLNSLTGEIRLGANANIFDAAGAEVRGATFISAPTDSTVRKSGELVFRASLPIFRFSVPAQTNSTNYVAVSRTFSPTDSLNLITPPQLPGTNRVYAFLINFADDIPIASSSSWRIRRPNAATTSFAFNLAGQDPLSLEVGNPHLTATTALPDNDWQLEARIPSTDNRIRIFNIFLLTFDQII